MEAANPRLAELTAKYGAMEGIAPAAGAPGSSGTGAGRHSGAAPGSSLASAMLRLRLMHNSGEGRPPKLLTKKVPRACACVQINNATPVAIAALLEMFLCGLLYLAANMSKRRPLGPRDGGWPPCQRLWPRFCAR